MAVAEQRHERLMTGEELLRRPDLVRRVWVVDPRLKKLFAYSSPTQVQALGPADVLQDEAVLPGFSLRLDEIFK
jgi:hypothetical protein